MSYINELHASVLAVPWPPVHPVNSWLVGGGLSGCGVGLFFTEQMGHKANGKERHPGLGGGRQV